MTDNDKALVKRLRSRVSNSEMLLVDPPRPAPDRDCHYAADRIEALSAENEHLKDVYSSATECFLEADAENKKLANEIADRRLGSSIDGKTIKELVSENKKLWAVVKLADEYIEDLVGHQGAEGFSETTYTLEAKYDDARAALGETK